MRVRPHPHRPWPITTADRRVALDAILAVIRESPPDLTLRAVRVFLELDRHNLEIQTQQDAKRDPIIESKYSVVSDPQIDAVHDILRLVNNPATDNGAASSAHSAAPQTATTALDASRPLPEGEGGESG